MGDGGLLTAGCGAERQLSEMSTTASVTHEPALHSHLTLSVSEGEASRNVTPAPGSAPAPAADVPKEG